MEMIGLRAHFDGNQIILDDPYRLKQNMSLLVLVAPNQENMTWFGLAQEGIAGSYGENEPEYLLQST